MREDNAPNIVPRVANKVCPVELTERKVRLSNASLNGGVGKLFQTNVGEIEREDVHCLRIKQHAVMQLVGVVRGGDNGRDRKATEEISNNVVRPFFVYDVRGKFLNQHTSAENALRIDIASNVDSCDPCGFGSERQKEEDRIPEGSLGL